MSWYYSKNGVQLGPVEEGELRAKISSGEVLESDLVWKEGMADWVPMGRVAELKASGAGGAPQIPGPYMQPPPQGYPAPYAAPRTIPNYLWQSIVVTLLCCMPLGVVGIVFAAKVDGLVARGDLAGAQAASQSAKNWTLAGFLIGLVVQAGIVVLAFLGAATSP